MGREDNSYIFNILSLVFYLEMVFLEVRRGGFSMLKFEVYGFKCLEFIKLYRVKLSILLFFYKDFNVSLFISIFEGLRLFFSFW